MKFSYRRRITAARPEGHRLARAASAFAGEPLKKPCKSVDVIRPRKRRIVIMNHPFQILASFLDKYIDEVEGRSLEEPGPEIKGQLQQFASGTLTEPERNHVVSLLKDNPHWLPFLAEEVKARRTDKP